jgi:hypothetical protein
MRIAYIILAHKLPEQLVRLVSKLNTPANSFLIHVNKTDESGVYHRAKEALHHCANVRFLKRRVVRWGTFSQVQAVMDGVREALTSGFEFDYAIFLSGQDYPIKSNEYIQKFLEESQGKSYLEYFPLPASIWWRENGGLDRINYWHLYFGGRPRKILRRFDLPHQKFLKNHKLFGGSAWWCLSRDCAEYMNGYLDQDGDFIKFWKYVRIPDESFFQTALLNSHLRDQLINDNLRYIVWVTTPHPEILDKRHFNQLVSSDKLFARKFDITVDAEILDMIDSAIS